MSKSENFYLAKLEWLGPILVRGLRVLSSVEALGQDFSFSQAMILQTLFAHKKEIRMNELAKFLGLSKANTTGLVDRLVKKKLIKRSPSSADRRVVLVQLTKTGERTAETLTIINRQGLAQMMHRIPEEKLQLFLDTLEQIALGLSGTSE
jgi:DNA-binding MarR family transcriptional regulator